MYDHRSVIIIKIVKRIDMSIGDFLHSKRWKLMQNYIYSWGASVVLIGALFKLEHLAGASVFLGVGLSIEAIIFFVSAFEPLMEAPDWKAVYPQLRTGMEKPRDVEKYQKADENFRSFFGGAGGSINLGSIPEEQMNSLKDSFDKLSKTASGLKDITEATAATNGFVKNLNEASSSIGTVVEANNKVSAIMDESVQEIARSYKSAAQNMQNSTEKSAAEINKSLTDLTGAVSESSSSIKASSKTVEAAGNDFSKQLNTSAEELTSSYKEMTNSLTNGFKGLEKSSNNYTVNLEKLNKNLASINTKYELHLKGAAQVETMVSEYTKGVGEIGKLLNTSVEETKKFNQNTKEINENIQALNNIYGKMLGALNGKK